MHYMGGKCLISKDISSIINAFTWGGQHRPFVSLFCGGCAVESKVKADIKICNDLHPYLIAMWQGLQSGWIPPDIVSKEEYYQIKANPDVNPPLTDLWVLDVLLVASGGVATQQINVAMTIADKLNAVF